jgi:hypothetical protein
MTKIEQKLIKARCFLNNPMKKSRFLIVDPRTFIICCSGAVKNRQHNFEDLVAARSVVQHKTPEGFQVEVK